MSIVFRMPGDLYRRLVDDELRLIVFACRAVVLGIIVVLAVIGFADWYNGLDPRTTAELRLAAWSAKQGDDLTWSECRDDEPDADGMVSCSARYGDRGGTWRLWCPGDMSTGTECRRR